MDSFAGGPGKLVARPSPFMPPINSKPALARIRAQAMTVLLLGTLAGSAAAAAADETRRLAPGPSQALLGTATPVQPQPGLELRRQDYDALGLGKSSRLGPLQIGEKRYEHGLGTHAVSEIVVRLPKPGRQFQAEVGVDQGWPGSVVFVVEVAGKEAFKSDVRRVDSPPVPVSVELKAALPSSPSASWTAGTGRVPTTPTGRTRPSPWRTASGVWLDQLPVTEAGACRGSCRSRLSMPASRRPSFCRPGNGRPSSPPGRTAESGIP